MANAASAFGKKKKFFHKTPFQAASAYYFLACLELIWIIAPGRQSAPGSAAGAV